MPTAARKHPRRQRQSDSTADKNPNNARQRPNTRHQSNPSPQTTPRNRYWRIEARSRARASGANAIVSEGARSAVVGGRFVARALLPRLAGCQMKAMLAGPVAAVAVSRSRRRACAARGAAVRDRCSRGPSSPELGVLWAQEGGAERGLRPPAEGAQDRTTAQVNVSRTGPPWGKSATPHYPVNSSGPASAGRNRDVLWSHGFVAAEGAADGALLLR
jgi:hypothetical protein